MCLVLFLNPPFRHVLFSKPVNVLPRHLPYLSHTILAHSKVQLAHKNILARQRTQLHDDVLGFWERYALEPGLRVGTVRPAVNLRGQCDVRKEEVRGVEVGRRVLDERCEDGVEGVVARGQEP